MGSGELIVTTTLGAENGYTLLWLILVSCSIKMVVQNELGRHTMSTGETTFEAFNHAPGPRLRVSWLVWLCLGLFVPICSATGAMLGAVAEILHRIVPVFSIDLLVWVVGVTTAVLLMVSGYAVVEKIALAFIVTFTGVTISCAYLLSYKPEYFSWASVADGLSFHMPETGFVTAVAVFGITGAGTMDLIAYPYWCVEKGYGRFAGPRDNSEAWRQRARGVDPSDGGGYHRLHGRLHHSDAGLLSVGSGHSTHHGSRARRFRRWWVRCPISTPKSWVIGRFISFWSAPSPYSIPRFSRERWPLASCSPTS